MSRKASGLEACQRYEAREIVQRHANNSLYTQTRLNRQGGRLVQRFALSPPVALTVASLAYGEGAHES